ncbi:MAG: hypothetical protein O3A25_09560 [Acidobacteria bacterium]|nr:hypothetical protein [Acidobacteriota bacterium]
MARRWVRLVIVLVTLTTLGYTANRIRLAELELDDEHNVERVFTDLSWALTLTLADLRAAEQAYVAAGQDRVYWTTKVNGHLATVGDGLENLRRLAIDPASLDALGEAEAAVVDLRAMDERAREHATVEQPLLASDLIFTDGLELAARAAANVELARAAERTTRNEAMRIARATQTTMLAASGGVGLLAVLLLAPVAREKSAAAFTARGGGRTAAVADDLPSSYDMDDDAPARKRKTPTVATPLVAPQVNAEPKPDLRAAAELCTDLSVLADGQQLPALLARTADLINASGLIVWVLDRSTRSLRPAIGHGYDAAALARIGAIPDDSSNATAAAYRNLAMQVVTGANGASGALAAPLRSPHGCVGVLSAELRDGWETSDAVQASAVIVAAQLATLLPSGDAPAEAHAAPPVRAHG